MSDDEVYKCVRDTYQDNKISYCGKNISGIWHFLEPTHAILNMQDEGRLLICKKCRGRINNIMKG